jgi:hypothetical protein
MAEKARTDLAVHSPAAIIVHLIPIAVLNSTAKLNPNF